MVVRKILEGILASGSTSISFTDTELPNSLIRVYSTDPDLMPVEQSLSGNTLTITYEPQGSSKGIAVEMVKQGLDIVDDLLTDDSTKALSANQGYVLKGLIDDIVIPTVPENITDLDDVSVSSIQNGQVLAWNSTSRKFENVNQSGGGSSNVYSDTETVIGEYLGKPLYRKRVTISSFDSATLFSGNIYRYWFDVSNYIPNVDYFSGIPEKSYIEIGSDNIRGFIALLREVDNSTILDCYTAYRRTGSASIWLEYTKSTD